jgi:mannose-1-phosphate guanylyltransferase
MGEGKLQAMGVGLNAETRQRRAQSNGLGRLQALVLLAGSVRPTALLEGIGRSLLDLPIGNGRSLLGEWQAEAVGLGRRAGIAQLPVRVMVDRDGKDPAAPDRMDGIIVSVERDPLEYRGTGGVLRDLAVNYGDDDYILVANAGQVLTEDLDGIAEEMADGSPDLTVVAHQDGTPAGVMLVRCKVLRGIASVGFVDMKEQALPSIAKNHRVEVVSRRRAVGLPIRTLGDYIAALQSRHRRLAGVVTDNDPFAEDWRATFQIVEPGAAVGSRVRIHDSVVMKGATVEDGAVLVRSVACPGTVVRRGSRCVDELAGYEARRSKGKQL